MSEGNESSTPIAKGGKVWSPNPTGSLASVPQPKKDRGSLVFSFLGPMIAAVVALSVICIVQLYGEGIAGADTANTQEGTTLSGWEQEYGYKDVDFDAYPDPVTVVTVEGETKTVDVIEYRGASVLFETEEQMKEKMAKIDAGDYPEDLYWWDDLERKMLFR